mmetsp:Transcript_20974/g.44271  ORF Transcript_20974/g.44271 Transcript_20974/m.44271 type:complete len:92 (-) Transcript_20974:341-616(-)
MLLLSGPGEDQMVMLRFCCKKEECIKCNTSGGVILLCTISLLPWVSGWYLALLTWNKVNCDETYRDEIKRRVVVLEHLLFYFPESLKALYL